MIAHTILVGAGLAMLASGVSSLILRSRILDPEIKAALFETLNRVLGTPAWARLLRAKHFLPRVRLPDPARDPAPTDRFLLWTARHAGFTFAVLTLSFLVIPFLHIGGHVDADQAGARVV